MKLTIYNTYVLMESQEQCDRMKQLCIDNNLPFWDEFISFKMMEEENWFEYNINFKEFFVTSRNKNIIILDKNKVTEQEFINLLNN